MVTVILANKYLRFIIENNPSVEKFLTSVASQSEKSALVYGTGLAHFQNFLNQLGDIKNRNYPREKFSLNEIILPISNGQISVYDLLEDFLYYLIREKKLAPRSLQLYLNAVRSYFAYNEIDIVPAKFKRRVKIPKILRYDEAAIDAADIRNILNSCNSKRLKAYLLVLASGGMRTMEAVAIRIKDIELETTVVSTPTKVHIRPEFSKTRVGRDIYISDEATKYLKEWIDYRYRDRRRKNLPHYIKKDDDLVFQQVNSKVVAMKYIYGTLNRDFNLLLETLKMDQRKENMLRHKITLNSFRRFVKTVISTQVSQDYSEWFLGHSKSSYWTMKEEQKRDIYSTKIMKYLTFLDYSMLEARDKSIESRLSEKDIEIQQLKEQVQSIQEMGTKAYAKEYSIQQLRRAVKEAMKLRPNKPIIISDLHLDPEVEKIMRPILFPKKRKGKK